MATGKFEKLEGTTHELQEGREEGSAVTLPDGSVLVVGGRNGGTLTTTAELFNPTTSTFEQIKAPLLEGRDAPAVALLSDGMVLIADGCQKTCGKTAELYDPQTQTFSTLASETIEGRYYPAAATLPDGNVLITGGYGNGPGEPLKSSELYNAKTAKFEKLEGADHELWEGRGEFAGVALQDGNVLFVGGTQQSADLQSAELFNSVTGEFEPAKASLFERRDAPAVAVLADGKVLVADGCQKGECAKSAEISSVNRPSRSQTGRATGRTTHDARINGLVESETVGNFYFQYGTSRRYQHRTRSEKLRASQAPIKVSALLTRLTPGKRYHYRVVVVNAGGTTDGADQTFVVPKHR